MLTKENCPKGCPRIIGEQKTITKKIRPVSGNSLTFFLLYKNATFTKKKTSSVMVKKHFCLVNFHPALKKRTPPPSKPNGFFMRQKVREKSFN